jgi:hypothetical protein
MFLQLLDPVADIELFRESWSWRKPKTHISAEQMSFETFAANDPTHLTVGWFNSELLAVYFFQEWQPRHFEGHFTSKKGVSREILLRGAREILDLMLTNGADEVSALIRPENKPLRQFVADLGMKYVSRVFFTCMNDLNNVILTQRNQRKVYVKYVKMKETPFGSLRQVANLKFNNIGQKLDKHS